MKRFRLVHDEARRRASRFCSDCPHGWIVEFKEPSKSRDQEAKYHAMIGDIAKQVTFLERKWSADDWKRLLVDAFARTKMSMGQPIDGYGRTTLSLDGQGVVQLGLQTRDFTKPLASEFIEYLYCFGSEKGVNWSDE